MTLNPRSCLSAYWNFLVSVFLCRLVTKVFDGWVMKGEKFPSSQDHPLPLHERYADYCDSGSPRRSARSSQNVAMVFFRVHSPGSSFTLTVRKHVNPFRECDATPPAASSPHRPTAPPSTCEDVAAAQPREDAAGAASIRGIAALDCK